MLSGDLYHYPQERTLHRAPPDNEADVQQSAASRAMIEEYLQKTKTALWIEHDFVANARLRNLRRTTNRLQAAGYGVPASALGYRLWARVTVRAPRIA